ESSSCACALRRTLPAHRLVEREDAPAAPPARDRPRPDPHGRHGPEAEAAGRADARRRGRPARQAPRTPRPRDGHGRGVRAGTRAAAALLTLSVDAPLTGSHTRSVDRIGDVL